MLKDLEQRQAFLADCRLLINNEVESQKGLSGFAIKSAYRLLRDAKPNAIDKVLDHLLDDFVAKLTRHMRTDPLLETNSAILVHELLSITDEKVERHGSGSLASLYRALRPHAHKHVSRAVPQIAVIAQKYFA